MESETRAKLREALVEKKAAEEVKARVWKEWLDADERANRAAAASRMAWDRYQDELTAQLLAPFLSGVNSAKD